MEALVDKLCNRFAGVNDVRQWQYISYCLSQLTFTEKGLKKLIDNFKMFEHALSEDSVMNHFRTVIAKCKKFAKPDLKVCIEEFEEKVSKVHEEKKEQEATMRNAEAHKQRMGSLDTFLVTKEAGQGDGNIVEGEASEVIDPSVGSNAEDKDNMPECSDNIDPSLDSNAEEKECGDNIDPSVDSNAEDRENMPECSDDIDPSVDSNAEGEKCSDNIDPLVHSNAEDVENTPESSINICSERSQTASTFTESEDNSAEVQSARTLRKGSSRSNVKKITDPVLEDSADSSTPARRTSRSSRRQR